jgi:hypothetical protein
MQERKDSRIAQHKHNRQDKADDRGLEARGETRTLRRLIRQGCRYLSNRIAHEEHGIRNGSLRMPADVRYRQGQQRDEGS